MQSEHAIGFLKGRFHSLKNLRLNIQDADSHRIATFWVAACVGLHSFAMECEKEECGDDEDWDFAADPFIMEGLSDSSSDEEVAAPIGERPSVTRLRQGREKRAKLKRRSLRFREQRSRQYQ